MLVIDDAPTARVLDLAGVVEVLEPSYRQLSAGRSC